jgi:hypothetical protein
LVPATFRDVTDLAVGGDGVGAKCCGHAGEVSTAVPRKDLWGCTRAWPNSLAFRKSFPRMGFRNKVDGTGKMHNATDGTTTGNEPVYLKDTPVVAPEFAAFGFETSTQVRESKSV